MKFPRVAYFSVDSQGWYKSRAVFWNQKEEDEWLEKHRMEITDVLIVEANEKDIQDSLIEGEWFIVCEEPEDPECYPTSTKDYKSKKVEKDGGDKRIPKE